MVIEYKQAQADFKAKQGAAKKYKDKKIKTDKAIQHAREQAWLGLKAFEEGAAMPQMIENVETAISSKDVEIIRIEEKPEKTVEANAVVKLKISSKKPEMLAEKPTVAVAKQALKEALNAADKDRVVIEAWAEDSRR